MHSESNLSSWLQIEGAEIRGFTASSQPSTQTNGVETPLLLSTNVAPKTKQPRRPSWMVTNVGFCISGQKDLLAVHEAQAAAAKSGPENTTNDLTTKSEHKPSASIALCMTARKR